MQGRGCEQALVAQHKLCGLYRRRGSLSSARVRLVLLILVMACWLARVFSETADQATPSLGSPALDPGYGVGSWIWADQTSAGQTCRLWKAFDLPTSATVKKAQLRLVADDSYRLFLDGKLLGAGGEWRELDEYDVTTLLKAGRHVIAAEVTNGTSVAGLALGLRVELADGSRVEVASDTSWKVVPDGFEGWTEQQQAAPSWLSATVIAAFGRDPWFERPGTCGVGSWIWAAEMRDQQTCRFWKSFQIPARLSVERAQLRVTADNSYRLYLDGSELGRGAEWRALTEYEVKSLLGPGEHVLAVEAFSDSGMAGMVLGLNIRLSNGEVVEIMSDANWRIAANTDKRWVKRTRAPDDWPAATVVAAFQKYPWQNKPWMAYAQPSLPTVLRFWQSAWFQLPLLFACIVVALVCLNLLGRLAIQSRAQQIVARERARIARDIHDDLNSRLTELVLLGELSRRELPSDAAAGGRFDQMCENARGLLRAMNEIIWVVNSQRDTLQDFASYACSYAQTFLKATPIRCRFDLDEEVAVPCGLDVRRNLFLAVKEALSNAVRHSQATELFLRIRHDAAGIRVIVEDNGRGFDPTTLKSDGNGLANMKWRAEEIGGTCQVISQPGHGCRVELCAPLENRTRLGLHWFTRRRHVAATAKRPEHSSSPSTL